MASTEQRLRESGLFNAISEHEFESVISSVVREKYSIGQIIVRQGDPGDDMYLIDEGTVEVYTVTPDGEELSLVKLSEGDYFGEQALLPGQPGRRKAYVRADTDCVRRPSTVDDRRVKAPWIEKNVGMYLLPSADVVIRC